MVVLGLVATGEFGGVGVRHEKEASQREGNKQQRFSTEQLLRFPKEYKKSFSKHVGE